MAELTHLSLFSGIGSLDLAAEWAGFRTVGQCEWADYPRAVLNKHWPDVPKWRDVHDLTAEDFYKKQGCAQSPAFPEDSRANHTALLENGWPKTMTATCGLNSSDVSENCGHGTLLAKMLMASYQQYRLIVMHRHSLKPKTIVREEN